MTKPMFETQVVLRIDSKKFVCSRGAALALANKSAHKLVGSAMPLSDAYYSVHNRAKRRYRKVCINMGLKK